MYRARQNKEGFDFTISRKKRKKFASNMTKDMSYLNPLNHNFIFCICQAN